MAPTEAVAAPGQPGAAPEFAPGDHIALPQDFNATAATIESITVHADGSRWALCVNAHDIFGPLKRRVNIPLATAKRLPYPPRTLSFREALSI